MFITYFHLLLYKNYQIKKVLFPSLIGCAQQLDDYSTALALPMNEKRKMSIGIPFTNGRSSYSRTRITAGYSLLGNKSIRSKKVLLFHKLYTITNIQKSFAFYVCLKYYCKAILLVFYRIL